MKIISMNIRGLGGSIKRKYLRDLICKEQVDKICIQETKCFELSRESCYLLWGYNEINWVENGASNNAEGIITMWRRNYFQMSISFNSSNYFVIEGEWSQCECL